MEYTASFQSYGYVVGSHNPYEPYGRNGGYLHQSGTWELGYGDVCPKGGSGQLNVVYDVKFSTVIGNAYLEVNGQRVVSSNQSTTISSLNVLLFSNQYAFEHNYEGTCATFYGAKIYDHNGNLVRNLIPTQRVSDGEIGIYDSVTQNFYVNSGSGEFLFG